MNKALELDPQLQAGISQAYYDIGKSPVRQRDRGTRFGIHRKEHQLRSKHIKDLAQLYLLHGKNLAAIPGNDGKVMAAFLQALGLAKDMRAEIASAHREIAEQRWNADDIRSALIFAKKSKDLDAKHTSFFQEIDDARRAAGIPDVPVEGLILYFPFEGDVSDASSNGINGEIQGDVPFVPGILGSAASFDGTKDNVFVPSGPMLKPRDAVSVRRGVRWSKLPGDWFSARVVGQGVVRQPIGGFWINACYSGHPSGNAGRVRFGAVGSQQNVVTSESRVRPGNVFTSLVPLMVR